MKPVRIIKMLRVLKAPKLSQFLSVVESMLRPPPFLARMVRLLIIIVAVVHVMSCFFWLAKSISNSEDEMSEFLEANGLVSDERGANLIDKYIISFYFTNTVREFQRRYESVFEALPLFQLHAIAPALN